ncbi:MAG: primosomal protein N' [Defluviitaleaceae bacterium]|nr:primosomal protein N' [Defluviitaleaceae bacterium]
MRFALVCVDVTHVDVDRLFHYAVPDGVVPLIGQRVWVPFGRGAKPVLGYVTGFSDSLPEDVPPEKVKALLGVCEDFAVLTPENLALAFWMRDKYYTTLAACIRCITPASKADGRFPGTRARKGSTKAALPAKVTLTDEQQVAVEHIAASINSKEKCAPILLHGVTGSGKTEVYLHAIQHVLSKGLQAIVLVPEIALTPQIVSLFTARFGGAVAVTHSRLTAGERFHIWKQALDGDVSLVIGPRSAVFAPFKRLGLIVIDEEHEHTYHSDTTPKYDARAVAIKRSELANAVVVLGSATPSLESYSRAVGDMAPSYTLLKMTRRVNQTFPVVNVLDMRRELSRGNTSLFATTFKDALAETLAAGKQAILFLNRRGHSSFVSCKLCGFVMACDHCRVNYTYHAATGTARLVCHYCGRGGAMPKCCPICESVHIKQFGAGTQKVEEEIERLFPGVATLRMDMDTTRGKHGHAKILESFRKGEAQILIGTQMVAKGLDFPNVVLVCVVSADLSLFTGDFRAGEYTFQLLTQVAGRAGRAAGDVGQVYLQTYNPEHYALELAKQADYEAFYTHEIGLRRAMLYPPFSYVFSVMLSGPDEKIVIAALQKLWAIMEYSKKISESGGKAQNKFELLGMSPAFVSKIKKQFRWKILAKCENEEPLKAFVLYCVKKLRENDPLTGINIHLTLNPVMLD